MCVFENVLHDVFCQLITRPFSRTSWTEGGGSVCVICERRSRMPPIGQYVSAVTKQQQQQFKMINHFSERDSGPSCFYYKSVEKQYSVVL